VIGPSTSLSSRDPLDVYPVTLETHTNKSTQRPCGRFAHAAALLVIFSVVLIAPLQSLAQLPLPLPLPGSLVVTLTSPRSGSTVGGTTPVTASVTIIGSLIVRSVQFKLDGGNLAGEDTSAPYAVSWDTSTAGEGPHTLTAVARDPLGLQYTSNAVTVMVSNGPPPDTSPPTVTLTSPTSGSTVSGPIEVRATASDDVGVAGVQFKLDDADLGGEDTTAPYAVSWDPSTASEGPHTLTAVARDDAGNMTTSEPVTVTVSHAPAPPPPATFAPGDVFVSLETGSVQWRSPDGTLHAELVGQVPGAAEGIRFDATGNLYVTHWCADEACTTGNTVEKFNTNGVSQGTFGSGYNCDPHALAFDTAGSLYVGQAHCTGAILKVSPGSPSIEYTVAAENAGSFWIDLAPDGCTIFYTSWGPDVKRFDVCTDTQLADFNRAPLPGGETHGLRVLPDGGVLVTSGAVVSRLDSTGALVQTYRVSTGEPQYWAGVDLVGDGTFWAVNYLSSNVYKFDLTTGAVLASFTTGTPPQTVVDVGVSPGAPR